MQRVFRINLKIGLSIAILNHLVFRVIFRVDLSIALQYDRIFQIVFKTVRSVALYHMTDRPIYEDRPPQQPYHMTASRTSRSFQDKPINSHTK